MRIEQVLQSKGGEVVSVKPDTEISNVARTLSERRIGAVIVTGAEGEILGILSERDIVRELGRAGASCLSRAASEMMTADPKVCAPEDKLDEVLTRMTGGRFRHMPVVQEGKMLGVISIGDVVKARLSELSMERDALEGMVMGH